MEVVGQKFHEKAVIINVGPYEQHVEQTYGRFHIKACPPELPYTALVIRPHKELFDIGDERKGSEWWDPLAIAVDIVKSNGLERCGIFVCAGAKPTQEEVDKAKATLEGWYHKLVEEGDKLYAGNHNLVTNGINDNHRRAVKYFNYTRDWSYVPQRLEPCPYCEEAIRPRSTTCKHCGAIIDLDRAVAGALITVQQAEILRKARAKVKARQDAEHKGIIAGKDHVTEAVISDAERELNETTELPIARQAQQRHEREKTKGAAVGGASISVGLSEEDEELHKPSPESPEWETPDDGYKPQN